ncbi:hypothetical protein A8C32_16435 [Flavivirga aquatica]|uniref:Outer membrane protein beta-barrel domain-containing protein n=1 Tax=Flavivirga aquatica TaxID=1849968 RepID=A0A1E5T9J8_9FLAO|nr:DUF6588 family protein [Flavivirga aquatica]OEK08041.1 hypothetical protein A8C32_16435 [Flavivirga aquatica]
MKKLPLLMLLFIATQISKAQELESILLASKDDANKLIEAYMKPAMHGLIYGMSSGWYHTAKVHKKLGFDVTIGLNASFVPSKDEIINLADLGLSNRIEFTSETSPTLAGSGDGASIRITETYEGQTLTSPEILTLPSGVSKDLPLKAIPTPSIQVSLGLPHKFDVMLRVVPEVGSDDAKGKLLGVGLKKELTSLLGPLDNLPLHVSLLAAYTTMDADYTMDGNTIPGQDQRAKFKLNSLTVQAIGSLNFPIINVYGGLGYSGGSSSLKMLGEYTLEYNGITETIQDPVDLDFKASGLRATLGARLSLGFFKIFGDYTLQEYNTLSAGMAFSFR